MIGLPADYYPIETALELSGSVTLPDVQAVLPATDMRLEHADELPGTLMLAVRSEDDLDQAVSALKAAFGAGINIGQPQVAYREKLGRAATIDFTHKKQSGGTGQFARIKLEFEPLEPGSGFIFESAIVGGAVPKEYIPGVSKGLDMAKENGLLAGYPVTDFRAKLVDGAFHDFDSSVLAFEIAARGAFRELKGKGDPRLMEPVVSLSVSAAPEHVAHVCEMLAQLGAEAQLDATDIPEGTLVFQARLAALFGFGRTLRDRIEGAKVTSMTFSGMRDVERRFPEGGGDDAPPAAMRLRA